MVEYSGIALEEALVQAMEKIEDLQGRVCPVVEIHKNTGPLVVYDQRREADEQDMDGNADLLSAQFDIHALHNTYKKMRLLSEDVKAILNRLAGVNKPPLLIEAVIVEQATPDLYEEKAQLFRRTYTVKILYQITEE